MNQLSYLKRDQSYVILVWWQRPPSFDKIYGKMLLYDKDEDFYILQILKIELLQQTVSHVHCALKYLFSWMKTLPQLLLSHLDDFPFCKPDLTFLKEIMIIISAVLISQSISRATAH